MYTNFTFLTTSGEPTLKTRDCCTVNGMTIKYFPMILWRHTCLIRFHKENENTLYARWLQVVSSCLVVDFFPHLNCYILLWNLGCEYSELDLFFTGLATKPTSVLQLLMIRLTIVVLLSIMITKRKNEQTYINSNGVQLPGDFDKDFHVSCRKKSVHSRKQFLMLLQLFALLLQWVQTLHSFDPTLTLFYGINSLNSDKLE